MSVEAEEAARTRRWFRRRIVNKLAQTLALGSPPLDDDYRRASGTVVCGSCGAEYQEHAADPREPWVVMLCDGTRVKL